MTAAEDNIKTIDIYIGLNRTTSSFRRGIMNKDR